MRDAAAAASRWLIWPGPQRAVALPLLLAALGLGGFAAGAAPDNAVLELTFWAAALAGTALAVLALGLRLPGDANQSPGRAYIAAVLLMLLGFAWAIHVLGMRQFGGYDMSLVVDFGWRQLQGQRFPADFPNTTPPSFLLGTLWAFQFGGVNWQSMVDAFALFAGATLAWVLLLWRALLGRPWMAAFLAASLVAMAMLPLSSWWYNPITSAAAVVFALSSALAWRQPASRVAWVSWAVAAALLGSAKPNVAGLMLLPMGLLFLTSRAHRGPAVLAGLVALAGLEGLLRSYGASLIDFAMGYREVAQRGIVPGPVFVYGSRFSIAVVLGCLALLLLPLLVLLPRIFRPGADRRLAFIGGVTVVAGLIAFLTSGEVKLVDTVIIHAGLVICGLATGVAPKLDTRATADWPGLAGRYLVAVAVFGISLGVGVAVSRSRVNSIGPGSFFEPSVRPQPFADGFFKGLTAGPRLHETHAELARLLDGQPNRSIFFGPRMQWAYAAFGQQSPVGQPIWLQPGFSASPQRLEGYFDDVLSGRFETLVFLKGDYTFFPTDFGEKLVRDYERVRGFERIDVYRRRLKN